jgi:hypothetical protein
MRWRTTDETHGSRVSNNSGYYKYVVVALHFRTLDNRRNLLMLESICQWRDRMIWEHCSGNSEWVNVRMHKLISNAFNNLEYSRASAALESNFCPECKKHHMVHDNKVCTMRFEEEEACV